jgi:sugar/nucleoside kinase (ribokinase family)
VVTDLIKKVDRYPPQDEVSFISATKRGGGGPALNILLNLRLLGATYPMAIVGTVGDDDNGVFIRSLFREFDIDQSRLVTCPGMPSAQVDVMTVEATGRRTFFYLAGAADMMTPDLFDFAGAPYDVFHIGAPGLLATMDQCDANGDNGFVVALRKAKRAGMFTNMELATIKPDRLRVSALPCLPLLDSLIVNEQEAGMLVDVDLRPNGHIDWDGVEEAARRLRRLGATTLIGIHFPEGGVTMDKEGRMSRQPSVAIPERDVVSAVGAGDAFASGLMFGLLEGWENAKSIRLAVANAAISLLSDTTTGAIRPWREALDFADAHGFRAIG